jgi:exodeoxyribonuclease VII small subunit
MQKSKGKNSKPETQTSTFEHFLKRLEEIVDTLEQGTVSIDDAMKMYEEGIDISKQCLEKLKQTELKLKRLSKDVNGNFELFDEDLEE